jgi:hypothetical protein
MDRRVVPFEPAHYVAATQGQVLWQDAAEVGRIWARSGPAFTALLDGEVLAVAGIALALPWGGVGHAWAVVTPQARAHGVWLTRQIIRGLRAIVQAHRLRRVEADVVAGHERAEALVYALGFRDEHLMRAYGPDGVDFLRCALFPTLPDRRWIEDGITHVERHGHEYLEADGRCVPVIAGGTGLETIAIIGVAAAVAGAGVAAYSSYQQGEAQAQQATYQRKVAAYNAVIAERQATSAQQLASAEADQKREQYRRIMAANEAAYGGAGVAGDVGSPLLLMADDAAQAELNARMVEYGGTLRAQGYKSEIPLLEGQQELYRRQATYAKQAGALGATASLLSGASSAAGAWGRFSTPRVSGGGTPSGAWTIGEGGYY